MVRNVIVVAALVSAIALGACRNKNGDGTTGLTSPSGNPIMANTPPTVMVFNAATNRDPHKYSVLWKGQGGPDDLINRIALMEPLGPNESWSGMEMEWWDFANDPNGVVSTTPQPFDRNTFDHFETPFVPPLTYPLAKAAKILLGVKAIPGGQKDKTGHLIAPKLHKIDVILDADRVQIQTPGKPGLAEKCSFDNRRVSCPEMPF